MYKPMKLYFAKDSLFCHTIARFKRHMKDNRLESMTVYPAKCIKVHNTIYCKHFDAIGKAYCGKQCHAYAPRNGKNGACKHLGSLYEPDYSKPLTIKI